MPQTNIEEEAKELRKRVKLAWKSVSTLQKEVQTCEKRALQHSNSEKLTYAKLEVANTEINQLKHQLQQSAQKQEILTNTLSTRLSRLEQECSRLRAMAMKKSSEIVDLEQRLNEALIALQTSRADTRMAINAAKKSQTDEQNLMNINI